MASKLASLVTPQAPAPRDDDPLRRLVAAWLLSYDSANTRKNYGRDLTQWFAWCTEHGLDPLAARRAHVDAYARHLGEVQGRSPATVARRLSSLSSFYAYALERA